MRTIIFGVNQPRIKFYCEQEGIPYYGRNTYAISTEVKVRGLRITTDDRVIKLCDMWMNPEASDIRRSARLAGIDLDKTLTTYI